MARIRSAKPEWWTDPKMVALPRVIRWTFKGLWEVCADDEGRFLADPRVIKGQLWPMDDDISARQIDKHLTALAESGRISLYVADGVRYGVVVNFLKHQKISHPTASRLPAPPLVGVLKSSGSSPEPYRNGSGKTPERLRPDLSGAERDVDLDVDLERSGAEGPPAPPADAGAAENPAELPADEHRPPTLPILGERALVLVHRMPDAKIQDGIEQLRNTLTAQGARLARGDYVRAASRAHLEWACSAVLDSPPDKPEQLARWVLLKLRDTFTEWRSREAKHAEETAAPAIAKLMQPETPQGLSAVDQAYLWLGAQPQSLRDEIEAAAAAKFEGFPKSPGMLRKHSEWIDAETVRRWKAATYGTPTEAANT